MRDEKQRGTIDYTAIEGHLLGGVLGDDAAKWARAFCQHVKKIEGVDLDEDWLIGWFANAIEVSFDKRMRRAQPDTKPTFDGNW